MKRKKKHKSEELDSGVYDPHFSNSKEGGVDPDTQLFLERASEDDRIFCTFDKNSPEILIYEDLSSEKWINEKS